MAQRSERRGVSPRPQPWTTAHRLSDSFSPKYLLRLHPYCMSPPPKKRMINEEGHTGKRCLNSPKTTGGISGGSFCRLHGIVTPPRVTYVHEREMLSTEFPSKQGQQERSKKTVAKKKPTRPLSAYNLFFRDERAKVVKETENPQVPGTSSVGFTQVAKLIATRWKAIDENNRVHYENRAVEERKRYFAALENWERERNREIRGEDCEEHCSPTEYDSLPFPDPIVEPPNQSPQVEVVPDLEEHGFFHDEELDDYFSSIDFCQDVPVED